MPQTPNAVRRDIAQFILVAFALLSGGSGYLYYQASGDWGQFPVSEWLTFSAATGAVLISLVTFLWSLKFFGLRMVTVTAWHKGGTEPFLLRAVKLIVLIMSLFLAMALIAGSYMVIRGTALDDAVSTLLPHTLTISGVSSVYIVVQEAIGRLWRRLVPNRGEPSS